MKKDLPELSPLELEIMSVIWTLGECSSTDIIEEHRKKRDHADTTVRTIITHLRKKGYVELVPTTERGYRFRPAVAKSDVARYTLKGLVARMFDSSPTLAIQHMLKNENLTDADLAELRDMIDAQRSERGEDK